MPTKPLVLVTIVAEAVLEDLLVRELHRAGATGHTVTSARGSGSRGSRSDIGAGNIRIESVVSEDVAAVVIAVLAERYFPHYAVVAWTHAVEVLRGEKFV